jgi:hypothetical protein
VDCKEPFEARNENQGHSSKKNNCLLFENIEQKSLHKRQGMTIGQGEPFNYIVINPGTMSFESRNPGALFVALSRPKSAGGLITI